MSARELYLRPLHGLCNRMRAMASAQALAAATDSRLTVVWEINKDVGAGYEEIFQPIRKFRILNLRPRASIRDALLFLLYGELKSVKRVPAEWVTRLYFRGRILRHVRQRDFGDPGLEQMIRDAKRTLITSWWSFYGGAALDFSMFVPRSAEQAKIDSVSRDFTPGIIGVHIRRTDNEYAIRYSPTHAFIAAMKDCVSADPGARFFLTTDSDETDREIKSLFGDRVVTRDRVISRTSAGGMREAVVDLFLLSRTSYILGSYYSTFSETAASIGRIRWLTVTDDRSLVGKCNTEVLVAGER